jgi:hypothetical protein
LLRHADGAGSIMLNKAYDLDLKLPSFRGKNGAASFLRNRLKPTASKIIYGLAMELDPGEWPQIDLRTTGRLEPKTTALFEKLLAKGDTYIDVGAHVGYHALVARLEKCARHFLEILDEAGAGSGRGSMRT